MPSASQPRLRRDEFVKLAEEHPEPARVETGHVSDAAHRRPRRASRDGRGRRCGDEQRRRGQPEREGPVYVDAFVPDVGESILQLVGPDSVLAGDPATVFDVVPFGTGAGDLDLYLKKNVFQNSFARTHPAAGGGRRVCRDVCRGGLEDVPVLVPPRHPRHVIPADRQRFMA
jgi:hypothetical protein